MYSVFIADDENIIREGIKCIIDWNKIGYEIVGEASNGQDALDYMLKNNPDLTLLDVRMPKIIGTDVVKQAREAGFTGKIIILSGFTDFKYTQAAIKYGVDFYLTKPIDEEELLNTVTEIKNELDEINNNDNSISMYYFSRTRELIIYDILQNTAEYSAINPENMNLNYDIFQVIIYEQYSHHDQKIKYKFSDLLNLSGNTTEQYESINIDNNEVLLLKGENIINKFDHFISHYKENNMPQKNSPMDTLFISHGSIVNNIKDIHQSYKEAKLLLQRRFFCKRSQHNIGINELPNPNEKKESLCNSETLEDYTTTFVNLLQVGKKNQLNEQLELLSEKLTSSSDDVGRIKLFLTDLFISVKDNISHLYHNSNIDFLSNSAIIEFITHQYYLYRIMKFYTEQFDMIIDSIGNVSSDSILDNIIHYIKHNYMNDIKLETIAPMFGYNNSYLGKIFNQKVGCGFNIFVDTIRIQKSKELLENSSLKVYEIAEKVGYHNVDYFHTKFKKYVNISPAEYRKQYKKNNNQ